MRPAASIVPVAVSGRGSGGVEVTDVAAEAGDGSGRRRRRRHGAWRDDRRPRRQRQLVTAGRTARHAV